jgi:pyrroline-5-carboxylate reductase
MDTRAGTDPIGRIGFIGTGAIASAIVEGLCEGRDDAPEVFLSPRGESVGAELRRRYASVHVCADNQEVVDRSRVVVVAVRVPDRAEALAPLTVGDDKVVISAMAGVSLAELRGLIGSAAPLVRAIPLPAVRERSSATILHPEHPVATALFERLGGALHLPDEDAFVVYSVLTSTISTHYGYLAALADWAARQGVPSEDASRFLRAVFRNVGLSLGDERSLAQLTADHETPGGSNERFRTTWLDAANLAALDDTLDERLTDLR